MIIIRPYSKGDNARAYNSTIYKYNTVCISVYYNLSIINYMKKLIEKDRKKLETKLDILFSKFIRLFWSDKQWYCKCISCGVRLHYKEMHNAHYIPRACRMYRRSEDNCRPACPSCNTYREAFHYSKYTIYMTDLFGKEKVEQMRLDKSKVYKIPVYELQEKIDYYKKEVILLEQSKDEE